MLRQHGTCINSLINEKWPVVIYFDDSKWDNKLADYLSKPLIILREESNTSYMSRLFVLTGVAALLVWTCYRLIKTRL